MLINTGNAWDLFTSLSLSSSSSRSQFTVNLTIPNTLNNALNNAFNNALNFKSSKLFTVHTSHAFQAIFYSNSSFTGHPHLAMDIYEVFEEAYRYLFLFYMNLSPLWLIIFAIGTTWVNLYQLCWCFLMVPSKESNAHLDSGLGIGSGNFTIGLSLLVISATLKATWLAAWIQCLVITWFCDRKWQSPTSSKNIMQIDRSVWATRQPSERGYWIPYEADQRPRVCIYLGGCWLKISDRVYHCTALERCLPVYDHFCKFIKVAVYLRTMKAYLFVLVFLPLDCIFSVALSTYALAINQRVDIATAVCAIVAAVSVICTSVYFTYEKIWLLAFKNCVHAETISKKVWYLAFKYDTGNETRLHINKFQGQHPWDLGISENLRQVFGQWWQWPFFWWQPERVSRYGKYADQDLPYADWVTRYRTEFLMPPLTDIVIDEPGASPSHGQEPRRRQQRSSAASRRSQQQSSQGS